MIEQYDIKVSNEDIDLLKQKIALTRWPDEIIIIGPMAQI